MIVRRFLLPFAAATAGLSLWACVNTIADNSTGGGGSGGGSGGADSGPDATGLGGFGGMTTSTTNTSCDLGMMTDPVAFCTQKVVLKAEHTAAFDATHGVAQSWDSATQFPDMAPGGATYHDPLDDAAYSASVALYLASAMVYGNNEINATMGADLIALAPTLAAEMSPLPAGYAGEIYLDLRTTAGGYRFVNRNDLASVLDTIADAYGRAVYTSYFVPLGSGDAGAPDGGSDAGAPLPDGILGTPVSGGGYAYAPGDVATGALVLIDMATRHATDDATNAALWQTAAASALAHLHARARDPQYGLYYAALVTSADPDHDALAPVGASGVPADALLTEVAGRVALSLTRARGLVLANTAALPALAALPLEQYAEDLIGALDATPKNLWDPSGGISNNDGGTEGSGYFTGYVPSTGQLLDEKGTRANAYLMAAIHRATVQGAPPDGYRVAAIRWLLSSMKNPSTGLITVVSGQNGYFLQVPPSFSFVGVDAGAPRTKSYFARANADAVEGLSELWVGISQ